MTTTGERCRHPHCGLTREEHDDPEAFLPPATPPQPAASGLEARALEEWWKPEVPRGQRSFACHFARMVLTELAESFRVQRDGLTAIKDEDRLTEGFWEAYNNCLLEVDRITHKEAKP